MPESTCSIDGCGRTANVRGWCYSHHRRWKVYGDPLAGPPIRSYSDRLPSTSTVEDRFWAKVQIPPNPLDCWLWTAAPNPGNGYGVLQLGKRKREYAHRVSYELSMGSIPDALEIDHLCHVRLCVNPLHLQAVPASVNVKRQPRRQVTHCPQGHPYSGDNLYEYKGHRSCRTCRDERARARRVA